MKSVPAVLTDTPSILHASPRRLIGNTVAQLAVPGARMLLGLILIAALSRYLGVAGLGEYGLVLAYVALFNGVFNDVGLGTVCLREVARRPQHRAQIVYAAAALQVLVSAVAFALLAFSVIALRYPAAITLSILIYGLTLLTNSVDMLGLPFQAELRMGKLLAPSLSGVVLNLAFALIVIRAAGSLELLMVAALLAVIVQRAWTAALSLRLLGFDAGHPREEWRLLAQQSWPLALTTVVSAVVQQGPVMILSLVNLRAVGLFVAAAKVPQQLVMLPAAVRGTTFPILVSAWAVDRARFASVLGRLTRWSILFIVPVSVVGIALAGPFVEALFGSAFLPAVAPLIVLIAVVAMLFPGILIGEALIAAGYQRLNLALTVACFPVLVAALIVLVPIAGATGAALAVLAYNTALFVTTLAAARKRLGSAVPVSAVVEGVIGGAVGLLLVTGLHQIGAAAAIAGGLGSIALIAVLNQRRIIADRLVIAAGRAA